MNQTVRGHEHAKRWLDDQENVLFHAAKSARVFSHKPSLGTAREFLVNQVLARYLPPAAYVCTGQVVDADGQLSKQVDILVYDPRFPRFEAFPGVGVYLAEGVIAAIEVKSRMGVKDLRDALCNCASVVPRGLKVDTGSYEIAAKALVASEGITLESARDRLGHAIAPQTYIFAYQTTLSPKAMVTEMKDWLLQLGAFSLSDARVPRVIVAGDVVGIARDQFNDFNFSSDTLANVAKGKHGVPHCVFGCWRTAHRFGSLAISIAMATTDRLGPAHSLQGVRYAPEAHLPSGLYADEMLDAESAFLWLHLDPTSASRVVDLTIGLAKNRKEGSGSPVVNSRRRRAPGADRSDLPNNTRGIVQPPNDQ